MLWATDQYILFFFQNEAQSAEKSFLGDQGPPPLSEGLDLPLLI